MTNAANGATLVTGGAGYIGSHAALALMDGGRRVVVIDDMSSGSKLQLPAGAAFVQGRSGDGALVAKTIKEHGVTGVMHFAASISVPESVSDPVLYYRNNVTETLELAAAAAAAGVRAMILSSTAAVYGDGDGTPLAEDRPSEPINPYGASKAMAERLLTDIGRATGMGVGILRYFNVAGADPQGRSGQNSAHPHHLIEVATHVVTGKRPAIQVFGTDYPTPDGTAVRDYVHVTDIADAHVAVLDALLADGRGAHRLYNLGYGRGASVREVLDAMGDVAGAPVAATDAPRRAGDPALLVANSDKIRRELGWAPRHDDLRAILGHALAWERRRRELLAA